MNQCTHCVTLFFVPLLIVARDADIGKTGLVLHLRAFKGAVMCPPGKGFKYTTGQSSFWVSTAKEEREELTLLYRK